jgi:predicted AlkP superfamily pyrophosphatase or phosphodiesterase
MTDTNSFPCKFLLVGFDGLRPCDITPDVMPNLARFRDESHTWENYLASFPTETYVNHPVIFSGFRPNGHGLIANSFYCPELKARRSFSAVGILRV